MLDKGNLKFRAGQFTCVAATRTLFTFPFPIGQVYKFAIWNQDTTNSVYIKFRNYGYGSASATVTTSNTTLVDTRQNNWVNDEWIGAVVTCNGKTMTVTDSDATSLTGSSWSGGSNPGDGNEYSILATGACGTSPYVDQLILPPQGSGERYGMVVIDGDPLAQSTISSQTRGFIHFPSGGTPTVYYHIWYAP